jgi:hypothetical protein
MGVATKAQTKSRAYLITMIFAALSGPVLDEVQFPAFTISLEDSARSLEHCYG